MGVLQLKRCWDGHLNHLLVENLWKDFEKPAGTFWLPVDVTKVPKGWGVLEPLIYWVQLQVAEVTPLTLQGTNDKYPTKREKTTVPKGRRDDMLVPRMGSSMTHIGVIQFSVQSFGGLSNC